jgi:hypothetical protein
MDYSYITRALLGLGSPSNFRYDGAFAGSVHSESSASTTIHHNVGDPTHVFLRSSTVTLTDFYLPGSTSAQGTLVDGLTYYIRNTAAKGASAGDEYSIKIHGINAGGAFVVVTLYEEEACHVVYNKGDSSWYLMSHLVAW